jgi:dTDP-4-dehydrorhamnose 3,5-epimerase
MDVSSLAFPDVLVFRPKRFEDSRGFFSETYNRSAFAKAGADLEFVQDNHSLSKSRGTIRGLHFQMPPFGQAKLVRVVRGAIFDVAVDIRKSSPNFGKWVSATLSADGGEQILIPAGYAHGFCTLEPDTEVLYKVTHYYSPEHEFGIGWDDPTIGINWPVSAGEAVLSDKDRKYPLLKDAPTLYG